MAEQQKQEPTGFGVILAQLDDGCFLDEVERGQRELLRAMRDHAAKMGKAKGTLKIALSYKVEQGGFTEVRVDFETKAPKAGRAMSAFWADGNGNLSSKNPKQLELGMRDVSAPVEQRDVSGPKPAMRGV